MNNAMFSSKESKILWVEDDEDLRDILAIELQDAGYRVAQAENGRQALKLLESFSPDLILCDIAMPIMDGYELLREVRQSHTDLVDVPFVFLSAQDGSGQITQGKYAGADDYLIKPVNFELMLATIAARLRQVQLIRHAHSPFRTTAKHKSIWPNAIDSKGIEYLSRMFNLITAGIVLLDAQREVLFTNIAARRLLQDCIDFSTHDNKNMGVLPSALAASQQVRTAVQAGKQGKEYIDYLSLTRRNAQRDALVTVCSLDYQGVDEAPAAVLFISAKPKNEQAPLKALEALFQLTPSEGRVAWAFAQGLRAEQIAENFHIALTTVAFHKRNIFLKTHTNRQADLVALLLTLPATVDWTAQNLKRLS